MPKKLFWIFILLLIAFTLSACKSDTETTPDVNPLPPAGIIAQGHVEPLFSQEISFNMAGQVLEVLVNEGENVTSGQVLARLSGGEQRSLELARAEQELLAAQQAVDDLLANKDLVSSQTQLDLASKKVVLADNQETLAQLIEPDPLQISQLEAQIALLEQQLSIAKEDLQELEDRTNPDELELSQLRASVANLEKSLSDVQQELDDLENPDLLLVDQLSTTIHLNEVQLAMALENADGLADGIDGDVMAAAQARLVTAQAALINAQVNMDALELRAPAAGTVVGLQLKPGQVISAGLPVLTIADLNTWVVKTDDLTEIEVVSVEPGEAVTVILDALPDSQINGTVSEIATRFEDRRGDVTYTVTIDLSDIPANLRWGMTGQVQFAEGR